MPLPWETLKSAVLEADLTPIYGRVTGLTGLVIKSAGPAEVRVHDVCRVMGDDREFLAEVVGFDSDQVLLMPLGETEQLRPGWKVVSTGKPLSAPIGPGLLGRVLDGLGQPMDDRGPLEVEGYRSVTGTPPAPLARKRITEPISLGVKAIDGLLTVGRGQRIGIFAGSGVGKSTLLGMIARAAAAECNVIALIGERGREVREFIENDLGEEGLRRSVVVVATSEQPPLVRLRAAMLATAIAEDFREQGKDVLLMMDSVTRLAQSQREVGLSAGEPPATMGYTPSVFTMLPRILERAGTGASGSVTGIYTVLVDGDNLNDPIADAVRGILDGHIVLSRSLAHANHYPAIDVLQSVSRVMSQITTDEHQRLAGEIRRVLALYRSKEDLISVGAYQPGKNPELDRAIALLPAINRFLQQRVDEHFDIPQAIAQMAELFRKEDSA